VVAASHNDVLTELYADLGDVLRAYLRDDVGPELRPENHVDHARLVEAIRAGDAETASAEAAGHALRCRTDRV
jgi:DNA-binding FadR family transcriptional regulator